MIRISKEDYLEHENHRIEVVKALNDFLDKPNIATLTRFYSTLWSIRSTTGNAEYFVRRRILRYKTPEQVAKLFRDIVLNENLDLRDRIDRASIPGFGKSSLTEILYSLDPNKYPIYNRRTLNALEMLGIDLGHRIEYSEYIKVLNELAEELEHVRTENSRLIGEQIPRFEFIDIILSSIYEGRISVNEVNRARSISRKVDEAMLSRAIEALNEAVKQYLYWILRGLSQDKAIERASSYALGMMSSLGILSNKERTEKLKHALSTINRLSKGMLKLLEDLERE